MDVSYLEDPNLLKLRSLDSSCPFFLSDKSISGTMAINASNATIARLKITFRTIAKGRKQRKKTLNAIVA